MAQTAFAKKTHLIPEWISIMYDDWRLKINSQNNLHHLHPSDLRTQ